MDYSRLAGPFIHHSENDDEERQYSNESRNMNGEYEEVLNLSIDKQSTESTDVNFLEIAERLFGRNEVVTLQQINDELKNEEINHYMQCKDDDLTVKLSPGRDEQECTFPSKRSVDDGKNDIELRRPMNDSSPGSSGQELMSNDDEEEDGISENDIAELKMEDISSEENEKAINLEVDPRNKMLEDHELSENIELKNEKVDVNEDDRNSDIAENSDVDENSETDEDSKVEKEIEKQLTTSGIEKNFDNVSIKYDKESQTYICVKMAKSKDKSQFIYAVSANQTDTSISARELPYKCKFCDEAFSLFSQLKRHIKIHSQESPFTCKTCGRVYRNETELNKHAKKHDRLKPHICKECGKSFRQLHMLQNHVRTHSGEKPFLCDTCGQGFGQKENLKLHERTHSGFKPHKCAVCGKQFNNTKCLHRHELTHSGERNYACDVCGKSYLRNDHLRRHKRTHGEEPKFKCSYCGKGFHQKVNTIEHERIHTGDKPFVCEVCGKSFTQRGNLKSHLIKHSFV